MSFMSSFIAFANKTCAAVQMWQGNTQNTLGKILGALSVLFFPKPVAKESHGTDVSPKVCVSFCT